MFSEYENSVHVLVYRCDALRACITNGFSKDFHYVCVYVADL